MNPPKTDLLIGDCREQMRTLPAGIVQCCVTSPPYWGLRDYGCDGQLGLEKTPEEYVANMVDVFREVKRVLRDDGTLWLNLGDSYSSQPAGNKTPSGFSQTRPSRISGNGDQETVRLPAKETGLKPKDLVGTPWRVAFALQADGWYLRQDIIWSKPNPMPESVRDRCTKSHEYIFLLTKSARYFYDAEAVKEDSEGHGSGNNEKRWGNEHVTDRKAATGIVERQSSIPWQGGASTRNRRSVWTIATRPYKGAHFATFPPDLIEPCILAGTSEEGACAECGAPWERIVEKTRETDESAKGSRFDHGKTGNRDGWDRTQAGERYKNATTGWQPTCTCQTTAKRRCLVLDPFNGSGTTGEVARLAGCDYIGCELNPEYAKLSRKRWKQGVFVG